MCNQDLWNIVEPFNSETQSWEPKTAVQKSLWDGKLKPAMKLKVMLQETIRNDNF